MNDKGGANCDASVGSTANLATNSHDGVQLPVPPAIDQAWSEACRVLIEEDRPTMRGVTLDVCIQYHFTLPELRGMGRSVPLCKARFEAWRRLWRLGFSSNRIGRYFGDRDHATVLQGLRRIGAR